MIAQIIGFARHLLKEWNNRVSPTEVVPCEFKDTCLFKDSGRARQSGEKWGLGQRHRLRRLPPLFPVLCYDGRVQAAPNIELTR